MKMWPSSGETGMSIGVLHWFFLRRQDVLKPQKSFRSGFTASAALCQPSGILREKSVYLDDCGNDCRALGSDCVQPSRGRSPVVTGLSPFRCSPNSLCPFVTCEPQVTTTQLPKTGWSYE